MGEGVPVAGSSSIFWEDLGPEKGFFLEAVRPGFGGYGLYEEEEDDRSKSLLSPSKKRKEMRRGAHQNHKGGRM